MKRALQCRHVWERKPKGLRYVTARGQCKRETAHPSGYCSEHRFDYRWSAREVGEDIIDAVCKALDIDSGLFSEDRMDAAVDALNKALLENGLSR